MTEDQVNQSNESQNAEAVGVYIPLQRERERCRETVKGLFGFGTVLMKLWRTLLLDWIDWPVQSATRAAAAFIPATHLLFPCLRAYHHLAPAPELPIASRLQVDGSNGYSGRNEGACVEISSLLEQRPSPKWFFPSIGRGSHGLYVVSKPQLMYNFR